MKNYARVLRLEVVLDLWTIDVYERFLAWPVRNLIDEALGVKHGSPWAIPFRYRHRR